jgi:hypothetical protein
MKGNKVILIYFQKWIRKKKRIKGVVKTNDLDI